LLIVPAFKVLYGSLDEHLGHHKRYNREEIVGKLEKYGFEIDELECHNFLSTFGWFLNGRILKRKLISSIQVRWLDKIIPLISFVEKKVRVPFGLSLFVVCRKKG